SMTFDNSRRVLLTDGDEVQITRRVYRDGQGEYLINHAPSRLKDIKDLFLGSGAGADAYCIIEQGRVDVLLQASTKERRTIFEEAAGISRFKARKTETLRRLERVDLNVQRLRDIIDEVEKQLRSVKLQASKAERYQEHSARLKELRVGLGVQEYHQLSRQLRDETTSLDTVRAGMDERAAELAACLARADGEVRQTERQAQERRQSVRSLEEQTRTAGRRVSELAAQLKGDQDEHLEQMRHVARLQNDVVGARAAVDNLRRE